MCIHLPDTVRCRTELCFGDFLVEKLALVEWRHWWEGAEQPFLVWPDLKNPSMEYINGAKRINSRQARGLREEIAIRMKMKLPSYPLTTLPFVPDLLHSLYLQ